MQDRNIVEHRPTPIFRDGDTEIGVVLERDRPNDHYSHLDAQAYLHDADGPWCFARFNLTEPGDIPSNVTGTDDLASRIADRLHHPQFPKPARTVLRPAA